MDEGWSRRRKLSPRRRALRALAVFVGLATVAAACGDDDDQASGNGGTGQQEEVTTLTVAMPGALEVLDPHHPQSHPLSQSETTVAWNIYESLVRRGPDGELQPLLATSLPSRVDDTTWRFELREGIEFTNGEPMNAAAVVHTIERVIGEEFASQLLNRINTIVGATAVDEFTVDVETDGLDPVLPARMHLIPIVPPVQSQESSFLRDEPVGTGPYVLESLSQGGDTATLVTNPDYWGEQPHVQEMTIRIIDDVQTQFAALEAGEVDLITTVAPDLAASLPEEQVTAVEGVENPVVVFNALEGITADADVRRALNLAVDKDALANEIFAGFAEVSQCQIGSPFSAGFNDELEAYPYDPDQAEVLIEDAGVVGQPIELTTVLGHYPKAQEVTEAVGSYWEAIGLEPEIRVIRFEDLASTLQMKADRPAAMYLSTSDDLMDAAQTARWIQSDAALSSFSSPEADALFEEALVEPEEQQRVELLQEAQAVACEEAAFLNLLVPLDVYAHDEDLPFTARFDGWVEPALISAS